MVVVYGSVCKVSNFVSESSYVGIGNIMLRFFDDISISGSNSSGTYKVEL